MPVPVILINVYTTRKATTAMTAETAFTMSLTAIATT
jgi:hypothetical protein